MMLSGKSFDLNMEPLQPLLDRHLVIRVFTFEGWSLFTADGPLMKSVFMSPEKFSKIDMSKVLRNPHTLEFLGKQNMSSFNGEEWKRHRKVINPIFHKTWSTESIGQCVQDVIDIWESQNGEDILIRDNIQKLTLDVLGKIIFNYDFHAVKDPNSKLYNLYFNTAETMGKQPWYLIFPILDNLPYFKRTELIGQIRDYNKFVDGMIEMRKDEIERNEVTSDDLVTALIQSNMNSDGSGLTHDEIRDNIKTFILAGHETTSTALVALIYYLARYPEVQNKVREEILTVLGNPTTLTIPSNEEIKQMKYLDLTIKESMRINTSNGLTIRICEEDYPISDGFVIPKGVALYCHTWAIHHNASIYPNPNEFIPERFNDLTSDQSRNWQPFLTGSRSCIGSTFSLIEQRVTIAMLLQKFEFILNEDNPDYHQLRLTSNPVVRPIDLRVTVNCRI